MMFFAFVPLLFLALCIGNSVSEETSNVLTLTQDNFHETLKQFDKVLVEFYAPWCGHCKKLAPVWEKTANALAESESEFKLAQVDASEHQEIAKEFDVNGFPTIKYFQDGKFATNYNGGRTKKDILSWLSKKAGLPYKILGSAEDFEKLKTTTDIFILGVFDSLESPNAQDYIKFVAEDSEDHKYEYAITSEASVKEFLAFSGEGLVTIKNFDNLRDDLPLEKFDADNILEHIEKTIYPVIVTFNDESQELVFGRGIDTHVLIFTDTKEAYQETILAEYRKLADDIQGKMILVNIPSSEAQVMEFFEVTADELPKMIVGDVSDEGNIKKFVFKGAHVKEEILPFLNDVLEGKILPTVKSEDVLPEDTAGDVIILKGYSFEELVMKNNKDVLVKFYAPWCGHCKELAPTWEELGAQVKELNKDVVIAKIDVTANDVSSTIIDIEGFPTIALFRGSAEGTAVGVEEKTGYVFAGDRSLEAIMEYLQAHAHHLGGVEPPVEEEEYDGDMGDDEDDEDEDEDEEGEDDEEDDEDEEGEDDDEDDDEDEDEEGDDDEDGDDDDDDDDDEGAAESMEDEL